MKPNSKNPWGDVVIATFVSALVWLSAWMLNLKNYENSTHYPGDSTATSTIATVPDGPPAGGEVNILSLELEEIENLANTIAGRNAIWPNYQGDIKDHQKVQAHFKESFAKFVNSGIISVKEEWKGKSIAFAYAVSDTGVVQFVGKIPGGNIADNSVYVSIQESISGKIRVTPAQDEEGNDIIMLYYIKLTFAIT